MKTTLLLLILCLFHTGQTPMENIWGDWKVIKVETKSKTLYPSRVEYFMCISKKHIHYYDGCNDCWTDSVTVHGDTLTISKHPWQTLLYCPLLDSIAHYIDYSGVYALQDTLLTVTNKRGKLYLIKDCSAHFKNCPDIKNLR